MPNNTIVWHALTVFSILLVIGIMSPSFMNNTYALDPKTIKDTKIYEAEIAFAESIINARAIHEQAIVADSDDDTKRMLALEIRNNAISEAKTIRDAAITDAWNEYSEEVFHLAVPADKIENTLIEQEVAEEKVKFCFLFWCWD